MSEKVTIDQLMEVLEAAKVDYHKFYGKGNKAASTRLRKAYLEVINLCKDGRKNVLEYKKSLEE